MALTHITDIALLEALNSALSQYQSASGGPFRRFAPMFSDKLELLAQLETHFVEKIRQAENQLDYAYSALSACQNDPNRTSCSYERNMVSNAKSELARAEENLATYHSAMSQLQGASGTYKSAAICYESNLQNISSSIVPNFSALIGDMKAYISDGGDGLGGGSIASSPSLSAFAAAAKKAGVVGVFARSDTSINTDVVKSALIGAMKADISDGGDGLGDNSEKTGVSVATLGTAGVGLAAIIGGGFLINTLKKGKKGMNKEDIITLQNLLIEKGYDVSADGRFGNNTDKAVKKFQKDNKLKDDGEVGKKTKAVLLDKTDKIIEDKEFIDYIGKVEGVRENFYVDSVGYLSIGVGNCIAVVGKDKAQSIDWNKFNSLALQDAKGKNLQEEEKKYLFDQIENYRESNSKGWKGFADAKGIKNTLPIRELNLTTETLSNKDLDLSNISISKESMETDLKTEMKTVYSEAKKDFPVFDHYPKGIQKAIINMKFNGGVSSKKYPKFYKAIRTGDWKTAAEESKIGITITENGKKIVITDDAGLIKYNSGGLIERNNQNKKWILEAVEIGKT